MVSIIVSGLVGGLIATIVMTVFMMMLGDDSPPPTAALWSKYVGDKEPGEYMMQGMVLHLIYGVSAGGAFALIAKLGDITLAENALNAIGGGIVYGLVLMVVGAVFWMKIVLAMDPDKQTAMMFGFFHLVYGIVLGGWMFTGVL